jgi:NADPH:quinone reductase-like Zn-dependent oxidoreductase
MRAMAFARHGEADVLELLDLPMPEIADDEVLVQVKACGLNHLDVWVRKGIGTKIPMPHIGGCETTGVISRLGSRVKGLQIGQRVLISPGQSCGRCSWCNESLDSMCPEFIIAGHQSQGGFAEYAKARACDALPISDAWSFAEWAAVPLTFVTAWNMLYHRAGMRPGDTVLIMGASSGVGTAGIQVAKQGGARVLAVAGSEAKLKKAAELGADVLINYNTMDLAKSVREATQGQGADIVFEHVGAAQWAAAMKCLRKNGRLVTCGATTGPKVEIDLRFFFTQQLVISGAYMGSRSELQRCLDLVERRVFRPVVDSVFPLEQLRAAQERMENREVCGKLVVTP